MNGTVASFIGAQVGTRRFASADVILRNPSATLRINSVTKDLLLGLAECKKTRFFASGSE
jgi:hypothetical protein